LLKHGENAEYGSPRQGSEGDAWHCFVEHGIDATSMDAIAERSGVSKTTLYKHWRDKDALVLEILSPLFGLDEEPPRFDSGDLGQDLVAAQTLTPMPKNLASQVVSAFWKVYGR
jgi:AcrR family transcriptional regulator